MLDSDFDNST